jgi:hypothetical protein
VSAAAATVRLAVVASSDVGTVGDGPLLYADRDGERVAEVLRDLGGVAPENLWVVPDATVESLTRALGDVVLRSAALHAQGREVDLWVYYTGHAGTDGLHVGGEVLPMTALKTAARVVPAAQRVFVVDACQSGQLLRSKGATLVSVSDAPADFAPPPDEAWIASAGAEENAFEVDGRRGALFTHFFVSGARGAADADGDARVTLTELYGFVHARTSAEAAGLGYVQEPRWAGALGDLVVSEVGGSGVQTDGPVPQPLLLVDERRGDVVAEIPSGSGARLAVPPGRYQVVALGGSDRVEVGALEVPVDGWATAAATSLRQVRGVRTRGGLVDLRSGGVAVGGVVGTGRTPGAALGPGVFVEGRRAVGRGVDVLAGGFATHAAVRTPAITGADTLLGAQLGLRWDLLPGPWRLGPAADLTAGSLRQTVERAADPVWGDWFGEQSTRVTTTVGWVAPHAGVGLDVPLGPAALVVSTGLGPAFELARTPRVRADATVRAGVEWSLP